MKRDGKKKKILNVIGILWLSGVSVLYESGMVENEVVDATRVVVVRHGESDHNVQSFYSSDPTHAQYRVSHLTAVGREQAKKTAKAIQCILNGEKVSAIYASPLPRTKQSAEEIAAILNISRDRIIIDKRLIESKMGNREGKQTNNSPEDCWFPNNPQAFGGETKIAISKRMLSCFREAKVQAKGGTIILVTHGAPASLLIEAVTGHKNIRLEPSGHFIIKEEYSETRKIKNI